MAYSKAKLKSKKAMVIKHLLVYMPTYITSVLQALTFHMDVLNIVRSHTFLLSDMRAYSVSR
jgi:hypothetical protein